MTLHDFFLGGTSLRVLMFCMGVAYCIRAKRTRSLVALSHVASIVVLVVIVFSREWATLIGIPVTFLIVERLTELARLERVHLVDRELIHDQHAINEQLLAQLSTAYQHRNDRESTQR